MHIDNQYVGAGDIDPNELFTLADCTLIVQKKITEVKGKLEILIRIANSDEKL